MPEQPEAQQMTITAALDVHNTQRFAAFLRQQGCHLSFLKGHIYHITLPPGTISEASAPKEHRLLRFPTGQAIRQRPYSPQAVAWCWNTEEEGRRFPP